MKTILLVDDEEIILMTLTRDLMKEGYEVTAVQSGHGAIAKLDQNHYDLVLTDLVMEVMDGIQVLEKVKKIDSDTPVIILTAYGNIKSAIDALRLGADDYLLKPCDNKDLLFRISRCLKVGELKKENKQQTEEIEKTNKRLLSEIGGHKQTMKELRARQQEIEELNANLENRVQEELEKSRQKDYIMIQQSRLAAMGEMMRYIIHQWGQPIWALQLLFHNLEDSIESSGTNQENTDDLIANGFALVKKMSTTMDDFKTFFQTNKEKVNFSINKNIKDILSLIGASFKYSNIPITLNEKEELMVWGFPNEYSQVILNILKNAKDAIIEKRINGEVQINILCESDSAIVRIKNNGGGIPEDILDKIFDSYFSTKTEEKGSGIGLYMSKVIIEDHMNGRINVKNTEEGVEFEINLPLIQS
jgi:C4-dicarboxylate-specific signal transduction histidine kinase